MEERDRLKGLIFWNIEEYTPGATLIWISMAVRGQQGVRTIAIYDAVLRIFVVRRWFSNPYAPATYTKPAFFTNQRFIDAVVAKIPDHIIAELTAHSIALSARAD